MIEIINFVNFILEMRNEIVIQLEFSRFKARRIGFIVLSARNLSPFPFLFFFFLYQYISIFRCRRIALLSRSWRYFIRRYVKRAIKELKWYVGLGQTLISYVHAQQIAMFSYLTGSLDYALSNRIFIPARITRSVVEYITANSHKKFIFRTIFLSFSLFGNLTMHAGRREYFVLCMDQMESYAIFW